jgi:hypothetical protein
MMEFVSIADCMQNKKINSRLPVESISLAT